jgi:hypothetical protein
VVITGLPLADLHLWGCDPGGAWWGLASWHRGAHLLPMERSAWLPATCLSLPSDAVHAARLPRIRLPPDRAMWPLLWRLDGVRLEHLGAVADPATVAQTIRPG